MLKKETHYSDCYWQTHLCLLQVVNWADRHAGHQEVGRCGTILEHNGTCIMHALHNMNKDAQSRGVRGLKNGQMPAKQFKTTLNRSKMFEKRQALCNNMSLAKTVMFCIDNCTRPKKVQGHSFLRYQLRQQFEGFLISVTNNREECIYLSLNCL